MLNNNKIGLAEGRDLTTNTNWMNLKKFYLKYDKTTAPGTLEVCNNESRVNLKEVQLKCNKLTEEVDMGLREMFLKFFKRHFRSTLQVLWHVDYITLNRESEINQSYSFLASQLFCKWEQQTEIW